MERMQEIDDILEELGVWSHPRTVRQSLLNRLEDLVRREPLEVEFATGRMQNLLDRAIYESDIGVRGQMFDVVERALGINLSIDIALDELVANLEEGDPALTCHALILIPLTGKRKYLPLVERYRTHGHELVRKNAEYAWKYLAGDAASGD